MRFKDFLTEKKEVHAVMAFGRMNPITSGHEKLVNKVQDIAKKVGGSAHIVVSHSQDPKKNPLSAEQKLKHAKRAFPGVHVSASDKDSPNFLSHAAKLHKQGVTHLHMVGGQDRVDEYHKLLHKYNGVKAAHGHFNFKHIEVHSAGDRDPDAEGVEGMSASKMREHASKGNFKEFKKGVPSKMSETHAKEMYNDVRKGMSIKESINEEFEELLIEGVHDQGIFKAVFLAGGPGSGKDYVLSNTLDGHGLTEINSDKALEFLMDKKGLDKRMPENETEARDIVRGKAKSVTELRQRLALQGRNGLIINGTGDDPEKIKKIKSKLEELGYDTSMILVNTNDEVSAQRNIERGQRGGRTVPETIRKEKWDNVQNARTEYAKIFADRYMEFDNSEDLRQAPPEVVKDKKMEMLQLFKNVKEFVAQPPQSPAAQEWVANELQQKDTLKPETKGVEKIPPSGSNASTEARRLGLQYYGFGRYGKNGKITHRSVHDKLVQVTNKEPEQPKIPVNASSQKSTDDRIPHKVGDNTIHVKFNKKKIDEDFEIFFEDLINEVVGQGGRDYEEVINDRLKKFGKARPDAKTAGSSADAPDATFLHHDKEHNLEIKKDKGAMFGQMELHHNGTSWDASEKSKKKYPKTYASIKKSGFFEKLNSQWKKPSGDYETDLKMGNVYHNHPNADPIKAHYGQDRKTDYIQIGGHGFYHTGKDAAGLKSPELHGETQIRARMKPRGYDKKTGKRTYGALAVMSLKGDVKKSHHNLDVDPKHDINEDLRQWFDPKHPEGGWKRINSKGEAIGPCAREPGEPKPKCMSNEKRAQLTKKERAAAVAAKRKHDPVADRGGKGNKPVNVSNFGKGKLSESVTVSITGDTVDEVKDFFNTFNNSSGSYEESYSLSDSKSDAVTLGKSMQPFGEKMENTTITNDMVKEIQEERQPNLLKDKNGRVRVFMLRSVAAKEAHTKQGTVLKYKNGYVIKLKEEIEDVEIYKGTIRDWIQESRKARVGGSNNSTQSGFLTESRTVFDSSGSRTTSSGKTEGRKEVTSINETSQNDSFKTQARTKITLSEIRQRQKAWSEEQINEIDRGIEPGLSMAGAGEGIGRDMGEKIKKRSHKVTVVELTGDETTASIGDQKEDELKKKGISLTTFKKRNYV